MVYKDSQHLKMIKEWKYFWKDVSILKAYVE